MTVSTDARSRTPGEAVVVHEQPTSPVAIIDLLRLAIEKQVPVEMLERLQALHERVSDRQAAVEFAQALATFQSSCPPISRTSKRDNVTKSGIRITYTYAELDHIARRIGPHLRAVGLSYSWDSRTEAGVLTCKCTLRHVNGHSQPATFACPVDSPNPGMSEQQKHAGALTYARRQSLIQVLGLTTCEPDDDGAEVKPISEQQAMDLEALIEETKADLAKFLAWAKVNRIDEILERDYESCVKTLRHLEQRRAQREAAKAGGQ